MHFYEELDFSIYIDFEKDTPHPQRIFQTLIELINAFEQLDRALCKSIDPNIQSSLILHNVETGSVKVRLRNWLNSVDDQALKSLDWKSIVGNYLVKSKHSVIDWINKSEHQTDHAKSLADLRENLQSIAAQTDVKFLPDYSVPPVTDLVQSITKISTATSNLNKGDKIVLESPEGKISLKTDTVWTDEKFSEVLTKETIQRPETIMMLIVKKPDYIGTSQWEFRHGNISIKAKIEDEKWLTAFQSREVDVRPGDALKCQVTHEIAYGYDGELIAEKYLIVTVLEVIENQYKQTSFNLN